MCASVPSVRSIPRCSRPSVAGTCMSDGFCWQNPPPARRQPVCRASVGNELYRRRGVWVSAALGRRARGNRCRSDAGRRSTRSEVMAQQAGRPSSSRWVPKASLLFLSGSWRTVRRGGPRRLLRGVGRGFRVGFCGGRCWDPLALGWERVARDGPAGQRLGSRRRSGGLRTTAARRCDRWQPERGDLVASRPRSGTCRGSPCHDRDAARACGCLDEGSAWAKCSSSAIGMGERDHPAVGRLPLGEPGEAHDRELVAAPQATRTPGSWR